MESSMASIQFRTGFSLLIFVTLDAVQNTALRIRVIHDVNFVASATDYNVV